MFETVIVKSNQRELQRRARAWAKADGTNYTTARREVLARRAVEMKRRGFVFPGGDEGSLAILLVQAEEIYPLLEGSLRDRAREQETTYTLTPVVSNDTVTYIWRRNGS